MFTASISPARPLGGVAAVMKTPSEDELYEAADRAGFAQAVIKLYTTALEGKPYRNPDGNVRRVAYGLVALRQALDHFFLKYQNNPLRLAEAGAYEADDILNALTQGSAHPIRKYLKSSKLGKRPPPSRRELTVRAMMVGAVEAFRNATDAPSAEEAAAAIAAGIRTTERRFSTRQLLQWINRSDKETAETAAKFARQFAAYAKTVPDCDSGGERILVVVREALHPLLAVPE
jgi:hypothetical protein